MPPKVIRDPVHNHIYFDRKDDRLILDLLNCREVQRLRRIRQLGLGCFTYPGAEHSRFSHSLGVCHLMKQALDHIRMNQSGEIEVSERDRNTALAVALLHDIGHAPLSHVLEHALVGKHEKWTVELLTNDESEVKTKLAGCHEELPAVVAGLVTGEYPSLLWLRALISSQLDVDRMDYLLRDSYFCGVGYGYYDHQYAFHTMRIRTVPTHGQLQPVWLHKARHVIEEYLFARYYMHWNVYYHRTTKGYEELLIAACRRAADLINGGDRVPGDSIVHKFITKENLAAREFAQLDDHRLMYHISLWKDHKDSILSDLCGRLLYRQGLKPIDQEAESEESLLERSETIESVKEYLQKNGLDPTYYFLESSPSAKTYDYYHPEKEATQRTAENSILIEQKDGTFNEISMLPGMERLKAVTGPKGERRRHFYVPEEHRDAVKKILGLF